MNKSATPFKSLRFYFIFFQKTKIERLKLENLFKFVIKMVEIQV